MNEIWKDIEGYDGAYQVSNMGRVKSVARVTTRLCQYGIREYRIPERIMRTRFGTSGYLCVNLHHEGKQVTEMIHRLVALHFCKGYADGMTVNHIDEVKTNNRADNLEWMSRADNVRYGTGSQRKRTPMRKVEQLTTDGQHVAYFDSMSEAAEKSGCPLSSIHRCCYGRQETTNGYRFKFTTDFRKLKRDRK
jgi:hypothetical protein